MKIRERSYSGHSSRPKPLIHEEFGGELWVFATPWGNSSVGQIVTDAIVKYISAARGDVEVTSPFEFMTCYSSEANALRVATLLANDLLYRSENKSEYATLIELVVLWKKDKKISWVQCGGPQIFIKKPGQDLCALSVVVDNSMDIFAVNNEISPLPSMGLGLESSCPLSVGSCVMEQDDQLILLSCSKTPRDLWQITDSDIDLQKMIQKMSPQVDNRPFWVGILGN
ncbi:MAG: hypothetical protein AABY64_01000 [Bdellovibrionota bacterium]